MQRMPQCRLTAAPALIVLFLFAGVAAAQQAPAIPPEDISKPQINVLVDCGAPADGETDAGPALQHCLDTHPNHTLLLPKTKTSGKCDYQLNQTLTFKTYSTMIQGVGGNANNNTVLCWMKDVTGIAITGGSGEQVQNISLRGSATFDATNPKTYTYGEADGIQVNGGEVALRDITITHFSRHGVNVDSSLGGGPNIWFFENVRSAGNRGDGFHFSGSDANAGLCLLCISSLNQGWGIYYAGLLPSTFVAPLTEANHNDPTLPKEFVKLSQIVVEDTLATVTTAAEHHSIVGDWGVIKDCKFRNKWQVISVPSPTTLQMRINAPDGRYCVGEGNYGFQAGARVWAEGRTIHDAQTGPGSYNVTSTEAKWSLRDMGTLVCVAGAGKGGAEFCSTIKLITGKIAVLADAAETSVHDATARIVTMGGPYDANTATFVQSYSEGNQEGLSQLGNSLTLGENWGDVSNPEVENLIVQNDFATPVRFVRHTKLGYVGHSIFQPGRAYGKGSVARDPSYEGFWNTAITDHLGTPLANLSFRRSNVVEARASGWNCFTQNSTKDGAGLRASSLCLPDQLTRTPANGKPAETMLPMFPAGGFWAKGAEVQDSVEGTAGLRQVRFDQTAAPKTCNAGDIFYKSAPAAGSPMGWVCPAANGPLPFGEIGSSPDSVFGEKVAPPKTSGADCSPGQWAADAGYFYICAAKNSWKRAALSAW